MEPLRMALTTVDSLEQGQRIAGALVEQELAACVNILGPIRSVYRWQGAVEQGEEYLLLIKTRALLLEKLEAAIAELHTYETPEFITLEIASASEKYLEWLLSSTPV